MTSPIVLFFRGLNSYGSDRLSFGPYRGAFIHSRLQHALEKRQLTFVPTLNMGNGSIEDHVRKALGFISETKEFKNSENKFHLLGHSTGGLIARAVAPHLADRVLSVTSMASPHLGTTLAEQAFAFSHNHPLTYRSLQIIGYDISQKLDSFNDLRPSEMQKFNLNYKNIEGIRYSSCIFKVKHSDLSWPVKIFTHTGDKLGLLKESDGFIEVESQKWGEILTELELDHLSQIGFNAFFLPTKRQKARLNFEQLCDRLLAHWQSI